MTDENDLDWLHAKLRDAKSRPNDKCVLLLGAGCSKSARIPLADEIPEETKEKTETTRLAYKKLVGQWESMTVSERSMKSRYQLYLDILDPLERVEIFREYIDNARMTWGYLAVAQLILNGYVDRILTTNFDRQLIKACSYSELFPAVYDVSTTQKLQINNRKHPEIYFLHGQYPGFKILTVDKDFQDIYNNMLEQVIKSVGEDRPWIVAGYSGIADQLVDRIIEKLNPQNGFFWLNYINSKQLPSEAQKAVLDKLKSFKARIIDIDDFDQFFIKLGQKLECFPPAFVSEPFVDIKERVEKFADFPSKKEEASTEVDGGFLQEFRKRLDFAIEKDEARKRAEKNKNTIWNLYLEGKYDELIEVAKKLPERERRKFKEPLGYAYFSRAYNRQIAHEGKKPTEADFLFIRSNYEFSAKYNPSETWTFNNWGNALSNQAITKQGTEADELFKESYRKFAEAIRLNLEVPAPFYNWGRALSAHAKTKHGIEADILFEESYRKYAEATRLKPEYPEAFNKWGYALFDQAKTKQGKKADRLFEKSYRKFGEAVPLKPEYPVTFYYWGTALSDQATTKHGTKADVLFEESYRKYAEAVRLKPDFPEAFINWGAALSNQANTKQGEEANRLFGESYKKFNEAIKIEHDFKVVYNSWGWTLTSQARMKSGEDADQLFNDAYKMYAEAVRFEPENSDAFSSWGWALTWQARTKSGEEADRLFQDAITKCKEAEKIEVGRGSYKLGCIYSLRNNKKEARKWLEKSLEKGFLATRSHMKKDKDLDNVRQEPWFQELLANARP